VKSWDLYHVNDFSNRPTDQTNA